MAYNVSETLTLLDAVTTENNTGSTKNFRSGRTVETARWFVSVVNTANLASVNIQTSVDGSNWVSVANTAANTANGTYTGTLVGPLPYVRAVTGAGANTAGQTITAKLVGVLKP